MEDEFARVEIDSHHTKTLSLTRNETLYIDDSLSLMIERGESERHVGTMRLQMLSAPMGGTLDLIEKITYAVLYTTDDTNKGKEAKVEVTEEDIYTLREIAQSYIKVGSEMVGFNWRKRSMADSAFEPPTSWSACNICRCRLLRSTESSSMMVRWPIPAAAR